VKRYKSLVLLHKKIWSFTNIQQIRNMKNGGKIEWIIHKPNNSLIIRSFKFIQQIHSTFIHSTNKKYENGGKIEWIIYKPNNSLIIRSFKYHTNFCFLNTSFSSLHGWNETVCWQAGHNCIHYTNPR
jgi:hypothetical protein